ncbi:outer membrane protein [Pelagibacterium halotolerans]|uniref:outer membrane protein n=1 Tax=Pelagibacterium halotolerans TaxID=531813 RepID=UPI00384C03C0
MTSLRNALATSVAFLVLATPAWAADPITVLPPLPEPPAELVFYDWTGPYVGVQVGYGFATLGQTAGPDLLLDGAPIDLNGPFIGAYAGYNLQLDALAVGIEGDINASWINADFLWGANDIPGAASVDWFGSVRGRLGLALDRTLLFATAGIAAAEANIDLPSVPANSYALHGGWTAGLGIEHAFDDNWLGRVEYRYYGLGSETYFDPVFGERDFDLSMHTVSVGLALKF